MPIQNVLNVIADLELLMTCFSILKFTCQEPLVAQFVALNSSRTLQMQSHMLSLGIAQDALAKTMLALKYLSTSLVMLTLCACR